MPAAGKTRDVTHRTAWPPRLMESCVSVAGTGHPAGCGRGTGRAGPPRDLICFRESALGPSNWSFRHFAILEVPGSQHAPGDPAAPYGRYAFRVGKAGLDLSHAENKSLMTLADRGSLRAVLASFA